MRQLFCCLLLCSSTMAFAQIDMQSSIILQKCQPCMAEDKDCDCCCDENEGCQTPARKKGCGCGK